VLLALLMPFRKVAADTFAVEVIWSSIEAKEVARLTGRVIGGVGAVEVEEDAGLAGGGRALILDSDFAGADD
jgi:hypothetical protein